MYLLVKAQLFDFVFVIRFQVSWIYLAIDALGEKALAKIFLGHGRDVLGMGGRFEKTIDIYDPVEYTADREFPVGDICQVASYNSRPAMKMNLAFTVERKYFMSPKVLMSASFRLREFMVPENPLVEGS